jgi:hypothetical protein
MSCLAYLLIRHCERERSNPDLTMVPLDCFAALAMTDIHLKKYHLARLTKSFRQAHLAEIQIEIVDRLLGGIRQRRNR